MTQLIEVKVPPLSETVTEGEIGQWFKKIGDYVALDESLAEIETEKVTMELPSPVSGILSEILVKEGTVAHVDQVICRIEEKKEEPIAPEQEIILKQDSAAKMNKLPENKISVSENSTDKKPTAISPSALITMQNLNIAIDQIIPTGPKGNIIKSDVLHAATSVQEFDVVSAQGATNNASGREERVKMSKLRRIISKNLKNAQNTAALLTTFNEINLTALMALRKKYQDLFIERHNVRLGMMGFFVKATIGALQEFPSINSEIDGEHIIYKNFYDIGVAVGSSQGLVVPVLRNANCFSIVEIEKKITDFGIRAKAGKLTLEEISGGTFTITNGGVFGSLLSTPIINSPQSGILGMHTVQKRPIFCQKREEIVVADMMYVALTYDHRIIDGREAVGFLMRIKKTLEDPIFFLLDI